MSAEREIPVDFGVKKKKSKLDKIYELKADKKRLEDENRNLRQQLAAPEQGQPPRSMNKDGIGNEEKLLEAMKTLKRITVNQEKSLSTYRKHAEARRQQIEDQEKKLTR
jgi:hypothetical protein